MSTKACDLCAKPIRSSRLASVYIDTHERLADVIAHDECAKASRTEPPQRFLRIDLVDLESRELADRWRNHLIVEPRATSAHVRLIDRAHIIADCLGHRRRHPPGDRAAVPPRLRTAILERDGYACRRCGATPNDGPLVIDHVFPVARGGLTERKNLQTLCAFCNSQKRASLPREEDLVPEFFPDSPSFSLNGGPR